jgi:hypothetical protein
MVKYIGRGKYGYYIHDDIESAGQLLDESDGGFTFGVIDGIDWNRDFLLGCGKGIHGRRGFFRRQ